MKYSLRIKLTAILIGIVSCVIFLTWVLNVAFAEQFYEISEKKNMILTYYKIDKYLSENAESGEAGDLDEDEIEDDPILRRLRRICEEEADDYGCEDATKYISEKYPDVYYSQT